MAPTDWRAECESLGLVNANLRQQLRRVEARAGAAEERVRALVAQRAREEQERLDTRYCPVCLAVLPAKPGGRGSFCRTCVRERARRSNARGMAEGRHARLRREWRARLREARKKEAGGGETAGPR